MAIVFCRGIKNGWRRQVEPVHPAKTLNLLRQLTMDANGFGLHKQVFAADAANARNLGT
jgi:hypothetical protein